jgi:hypothetical protein
MNLVGKILVVLIAVMSLVFASFAVMVYAAHVNWRTLVVNETAGPGKPLGLQVELRTLRESLDALTKQKEQLANAHASELKARDEALGKLETERKDLEQARDEAQKRFAEKDKTLREATAALKAAEDNTLATTKERDKLRAQVLALREDRDAQFKKVVARTDEMHAAVVEVNRLKARNEELLQDLGRARDLLARNNIKIDEPPTDKPPASLRGVVLALQGSDLIEISVGADDGLSKGHKLEVYRMDGTANTYLGRVNVVSVEPNRAVCKIDPNFRKGPIQRGDTVAARID